YYYLLSYLLSSVSHKPSPRFPEPSFSSTMVHCLRRHCLMANPWKSAEVPRHPSLHRRESGSRTSFPVRAIECLSCGLSEVREAFSVFRRPVTLHGRLLKTNSRSR